MDFAHAFTMAFRAFGVRFLCAVKAIAASVRWVFRSLARSFHLCIRLFHGPLIFGRAPLVLVIGSPAVSAANPAMAHNRIRVGRGEFPPLRKHHISRDVQALCTGFLGRRNGTRNLSIYQQSRAFDIRGLFGVASPDGSLRGIEVNQVFPDECLLFRCELCHKVSTPS